MLTEVTRAAPPSPAGKPSILIVCTANVCRSPAAQFLLRHALGAAADGYLIASAGTAAREGIPMDPVIGELLQRRGVRFAPFSARRLDAGMIAGADLVLTATTRQRAEVVHLAPAAVRKTLTLTQLARYAPVILEAGEPPLAAGSRITRLLAAVPAARARAARPASDSVADPTGRSRRHYVAAVDELQRACAAIAPLLVAPPVEVGGLHGVPAGPPRLAVVPDQDDQGRAAASSARRYASWARTDIVAAPIRSGDRSV